MFEVKGGHRSRLFENRVLRKDFFFVLEGNYVRMGKTAY